MSRSFAPRRYHHTPAQIAQELRIDEEGNLWWLKRKGPRNLKEPAGSRRSDGYREIKLDYTSYLAHVIAWCLYYGEWPQASYDIDHINGQKTDNRKENLRLLTRSKNALNTNKRRPNNVSGFPGVEFHKARAKWRAYITVDYKRIHGGTYNTKEEAIAARLKLEALYEHGYVSAQAEPQSALNNPDLKL